MIAWHSVVPPFWYGYSISLSASLPFSYSCFAFCCHRRHDVALTLQVIIGSNTSFTTCVCTHPCINSVHWISLVLLLFTAILSCRTLFSNDEDTWARYIPLLAVPLIDRLSRVGRHAWTGSNPPINRAYRVRLKTDAGTGVVGVLLIFW